MPKYKTGQTEWKSWALGFFSCLFGGSFCLGFFVVVDLFCLFVLILGAVCWGYGCFLLVFFLFGFVWGFFWFICRKEKKKNKIGANCKAFSLNFKLV